MIGTIFTTPPVEPVLIGSRPAPGTSVIANDMGHSHKANPQSRAFDFAFKPSLNGTSLIIGHGYIQSLAADGPHAPTINGRPIGGTPGPVLALDPSIVSANGESYAVLNVVPDAKGQITAKNVPTITHSAITSSNVATLGLRALVLILWMKGVPVRVLPIVMFNLQYALLVPTAGGGAPVHFFA